MVDTTRAGKGGATGSRGQRLMLGLALLAFGLRLIAPVAAGPEQHLSRGYDYYLEMAGHVVEGTGFHRTLPFGVVVRVTRLDSGRQVKVRITDRGPFVEGRIIDLSRAAARKLDMVEDGIARVRIEEVR